MEMTQGHDDDNDVGWWSSGMMLNDDDAIDDKWWRLLTHGHSIILFLWIVLVTKHFWKSRCLSVALVHLRVRRRIWLFLPMHYGSTWFPSINHWHSHEFGSERASKHLSATVRKSGASRAEQANEWALWADEQVTQFLHPASWLYWTIVLYNFGWNEESNFHPRKTMW